VAYCGFTPTPHEFFGPTPNRPTARHDRQYLGWIVVCVLNRSKATGYDRKTTRKYLMQPNGVPVFGHGIRGLENSIHSDEGEWMLLINHEEARRKPNRARCSRSPWSPPSTCAPAARKAWLGLVRYIDASGASGSGCEGTKKRTIYSIIWIEPRLTGDLHGQSPMLWTASALLR
jgi:hypothetical protein